MIIINPGMANGQWWARLSATKRKDLRQLMRHSGFVGAFSKLTRWPGMWVGLKLGTLHRLLTVKCDEVNGSHPCIVCIIDVW